jgi:hypothetical protein
MTVRRYRGQCEYMPCAAAFWQRDCKNGAARWQREDNLRKWMGFAPEQLTRHRSGEVPVQDGTWVPGLGPLGIGTPARAGQRKAAARAK